MYGSIGSNHGKTHLHQSSFEIALFVAYQHKILFLVCINKVGWKPHVLGPSGLQDWNYLFIIWTETLECV